MRNGELGVPAGDHSEALTRSVRRKHKHVILGRDVLVEVRSDMAATTYPSFLGRAPPNVGSASAGTLSADQWRTFCLVNLPISLIRLWSGLEPTNRKTLLLHNFIDLVVAVKRGSAKRVTPDLIESFETRILQYVRGIRDLFPEIPLAPNHHIALHIGEVMRLFGPTSAYWAFPFERFIRLLRDVNKNFRPS
ncbi:hypothetical protein OH77DRAFT_1577755 [Trametes cingulata]|nr:hypothetical protein OH77DRAFT_1577755 [Trametes cingulata]